MEKIIRYNEQFVHSELKKICLAQIGAIPHPNKLVLYNFVMENNVVAFISSAEIPLLAEFGKQIEVRSTDFYISEKPEFKYVIPIEALLSKVPKSVKQLGDINLIL